MQALSPVFLLIIALVTNAFAIPAASAGALKSRQSYAMANLMLTVYSDSSECSGPSLGISMEYNTDYPVDIPGGISSYLVSRNLTAIEQMDFSTTGPAATLSSGYVIAPPCAKFVKTVSPDNHGELLTAGTPEQPTCYLASGEQCVRIFYHT